MPADLLSRSHATEGLSVLLLIHGPIGRLQTQVGTTDPATREAGRSCLSEQYGGSLWKRG